MTLTTVVQGHATGVSGLRIARLNWLITLMCSAACVGSAAEGPDDPAGAVAASVVWDEQRQGWQVGAKWLSASGALEVLADTAN